VHSTSELSPSSFSITVGGRPGDLDDVFPGFSDRDRLGVVVRRPGGAVGASLLILAAVTAFYDVQRRRSEDFFIYPDYFILHAGRPFGDHRRLEIWPSHKEVMVLDEPEELLRAINDRGVTRLLVEDGRPRDAVLADETLASARGRIATTLAYAPGGRVRQADVELSGNAVTESYAAGVLERSGGLPSGLRTDIAAARRRLLRSGRPVETYRFVGLDDALGLLAGHCAVAA
jgi:hypothetical protein